MGSSCAREKYSTHSWFRAQRAKGKGDKVKLKRGEGTRPGRAALVITGHMVFVPRAQDGKGRFVAVGMGVRYVRVT